MKQPDSISGFTPSPRCTPLFAELIASLVLTVCTVAAITVVAIS
jgi:hypothetical protein